VQIVIGEFTSRFALPDLRPPLLAILMKGNPVGSAELVLQFVGRDRVNVSFAGTDSGALEFSNPITSRTSP